MSRLRATYPKNTPQPSLILTDPTATLSSLYAQSFSDPLSDRRELFVWTVLSDRVLQMEHLANYLRDDFVALI